jgi:hypothetical protein
MADAFISSSTPQLNPNGLKEWLLDHTLAYVLFRPPSHPHIFSANPYRLSIE